MDRDATTQLLRYLREVYHDDPPQRVEAYAQGLRYINIPPQRFCDEALAHSTGFPSVADLVKVARILFTRIAEMQWGGILRVLDVAPTGPITCEDPAASFALHSLWSTLSVRPSEAGYLKRQFIDQFLIAATGASVNGRQYEGRRQLPLYRVLRSGDVEVLKGGSAASILGLRQGAAEEQERAKVTEEDIPWMEDFEKRVAANLVEPGRYEVRQRIKGGLVVITHRTILDPSIDYTAELERKLGVAPGWFNGLCERGEQGEILKAFSTGKVPGSGQGGSSWEHHIGRGIPEGDR